MVAKLAIYICPVPGCVIIAEKVRPCSKHPHKDLSREIYEHRPTFDSPRSGNLGNTTENRFSFGDFGIFGAILEKEYQGVSDPAIMPKADLVATQTALARAESERDDFREGFRSRGRDINRMGDLLRHPPQEVADRIESMESRYPETVIARAVCDLILDLADGDR